MSNIGQWILAFNNKLLHTSFHRREIFEDNPSKPVNQRFFNYFLISEVKCHGFLKLYQSNMRETEKEGGGNFTNYEGE